MKKILNALLILILLISVAYGAATDYKVKADGTIYGYDLIVKGPWVDARAYTTFALALTAAANKTLVIDNTQILYSSTWTLMVKVSSDPDTALWGATEVSRIWFNTTDKKFKGWNGEEIILLG
ncbi:MAG: hypothetical protein WA066_02975 [Candidatus Omnitrophota bacterium]